MSLNGIQLPDNGSRANFRNVVQNLNVIQLTEDHIQYNIDKTFN
jgi:hypothetical protein